MGKKQRRRRFTAEYKAEIVRLVQEGRSVSEVAREHDLSRQVVYEWVEGADPKRSVALVATEAPLSKSEREELLRLRREKRAVTESNAPIVTIVYP